MLRSLILLALVEVLLGRGRAAAAEVAPSLVLAGRVDAVTPAGDGVAALRDGEVVLLDAAGLVVGGCHGEGARPGARRRRDRTARATEEVLREAGFSDEDVSPEAEDLLDDEGIAPPRRRRTMRPASGPPRARALAGDGAAVWIATAQGLWRLGARDGSCAPAGLGGQAIDLVAARGETVVAVADATLWRSRDAGLTFEVAAVSSSRVHALALAADAETALVADEDGVVEVGPARGVARRLDGRVDALASCGGEVIALASDGVHRLDAAGGDVLAGPRPPVRALACGRDGLVAAGVGVWTSAAGGRWREEAAGLGRTFAAVAWAAEHTWLAGEGGLERLEAGGAGQAGIIGEAAIPEPPPARPGPRRPPAWAGLLPRVGVVYDRWSEAGVAGWRLWLLVTVSLDPRRRGAPADDVEDLR